MTWATPSHCAVRWDGAERQAVEGSWFRRARDRRIARRERLSSGVHGSIREGGVRASRVPEEVTVRYSDGETGRGSGGAKTETSPARLRGALWQNDGLSRPRLPE